jgi:EmrB/QacA subfamily drug resistance transporter
MSVAIAARAPRIPAAPPEAAAPYAQRWRMLPVILLAMFMAQFDLYVVNVALPLLQTDIGAGQVALELIVGGYAFMYAAGLITGGRLGDLFGHRRLFVFGMLAFAVASLLSGIAQTPGELVAARLLQGLTAAAMVPQVLALVTAVFPPQERARALAWFGVTMGVGAVAGQVLGGLLLDADVLGLSWRAIFLVNVPIGVAAAILGQRLIPARTSGRRPKLDPVGVIAVSGSLGLLLVPLALGRSEDWPAWTFVCLAAAVPAMVAAVAWERRLARRGGEPLLNLGLFGDRVFNWGLLVNVGAFASFFSFMFTLTLVLQQGIGLTPLQAGLAFAPLGVAFAVASIVAKGLIPRHGTRVITAGLGIVVVGLACLLVVAGLAGSETTALELLGPMAIVGFGNGLGVPAVIGAVLAGIRSKQAGAAAGVLTTSQQFASAAGIAVLGSVFFAALGTKTGTGAYVSALEWSASCSLALALAAAVMSTRLAAARTA